MQENTHTQEIVLSVTTHCRKDDPHMVYLHQQARQRSDVLLRTVVPLRRLEESLGALGCDVSHRPSLERLQHHGLALRVQLGQPNQQEQPDRHTSSTVVSTEGLQLWARVGGSALTCPSISQIPAAVPGSCHAAWLSLRQRLRPHPAARRASPSRAGAPEAGAPHRRRPRSAAGGHPRSC
jgi:hypothetical protein